MEPITITPPSKPKKITGTRFASVLNMNPWSTPFEAWCAITRTYEKPFEDTVYTIAGKTIEPKQMEYMRTAYGMDNLVTPTDVYGADYFSKTWGDFFPEEKIFGGMWDAFTRDDENQVEAIIEFKTTKRAEDWKDDIPEYYALQASLYAYLMGVDDVIMVCSFLSDTDYENPDRFEPSAENTITKEFKVSQRYRHFKDWIEKAENWWAEHVEGGVSPEPDEKLDKEILDVLKTKIVTPDTDIEELISKAEELKLQIDNVTSKIKASEKELKDIQAVIKESLISEMGDEDDKCTVSGKYFDWEVKKTVSEKVDDKKLKENGLFDEYKKISETYTLRLKSKEV